MMHDIFVLVHFSQISRLDLNLLRADSQTEMSVALCIRRLLPSPPALCGPSALQGYQHKFAVHTRLAALALGISDAAAQNSTQKLGIWDVLWDAWAFLRPRKKSMRLDIRTKLRPGTPYPRNPFKRPKNVPSSKEAVSEILR